MVAVNEKNFDAKQLEMVSALVEARTLVHHAEQLLAPARVLLEGFKDEMLNMEAWEKTPPVDVEEARAVYTSTRDANEALRQNAYALKQFAQKVQAN